MSALAATFITAFVISFLTVPVLIKYSLKRNLVDLPGLRKIHTKVTPSMGGIAIFLGFSVSAFVWIDFEYWHEIRLIAVALFVIFFVGLRDDLVPLSPSIKLLGQLLVAFMIVLTTDLRIHTMEGMLGIHELPTTVSYLVTVFIIIIITNSFNLIDGIDGLASSIASISLFAFSVWFYLAGHQVLALLGISLLGGLIAFLIFNWDPAKVFMGDTGALLIGMMLAVQALFFIQINQSLPKDNPYHFVGGAASAICFLLVPLMDTLRIIVIRIASGRSPFTPDKNHIHHNLIRLGLSHGRTTILLGGIQLVGIVAAISFRWLSSGAILIGLGISTVFVSLLLYLMVRKVEIPSGTVSDSTSK